MGYFDWTDDLSVGVKEIDDQHRKLVDMLNTLGIALRARTGRDVQKAVVDGFVESASAHVAAEERYLATHGYPLHGAHKAEHQKLMAWTAELKQKVGSSGFVLTLEVLDRLKVWLQNHFAHSDRNCAR